MQLYRRLKEECLKDGRGYMLLIFASYLLFGIIAVGFGKIQLDERVFHLPTVKSFYSTDFLGVIKGDDYKTASTPLPYMITALLHRVAGVEPDLWSVRLVNITVSLLTLGILFWLLSSLRIAPFPYITVLFFYPYFLKPSFTFHMAGFGLLFYFLFLKYSGERGLIRQFISGFALCCAVLSQQFYLVLIALPFLLMALPGEDSVTPKKVISTVCKCSLCLMPVVFLFFIWGGLTHPNFRIWGVQFSPQNLAGVLTVLGITFLPVILSELRKEKTEWLMVMLLAGVLLGFIFFPKWSSIPGPGSMPGMTFNILEKISVWSPIAGGFMKTILIFLGILAIRVLFRNDHPRPVLLIALGLLVVAFSINKIPSERHMLPLVATAMIMMFPLVKPSHVRNIWLPYQAVIGITYFIYMMFFTLG